MGSRPGIFVQQHFNFGPLGPRDWSLDEMRRLFSWLKDLGYEVPEDIELRVVDSTADCRYLILPRRPAGTEGWSEEKLTALVTRDSMIGVGNALTPAEFEAGAGALLG